MTAPRELRGLVAVEIAAVLAVAVLPLPELLPIGLPLLVLGTLSRWVRGRDWDALVAGRPGAAAIGAAAGLAALALALLAGTPVVELLSGRSVEWSTVPLVRGNASQLAVAALVVGAGALATELALRGWIVERVLELAGARMVVIAVLVGAVAEALVTRGAFAARAGAGLFGAGLGWMYVAGGRSVLAPVCARVMFAVGALVLESLRLVG